MFSILTFLTENILMNADLQENITEILFHIAKIAAY